MLAIVMLERAAPSKVSCSYMASRRGDGDRGQTKGLTREEGRRGGAQLEAGEGEDLKGGKRLRDQRGGAGEGKTPKGLGHQAELWRLLTWGWQGKGREKNWERKKQL